MSPLGDVLQDLQWMSETLDSTKPDIYYVFSYDPIFLFAFMVKFFQKIVHARWLHFSLFHFLKEQFNKNLLSPKNRFISFTNDFHTINSSDSFLFFYFTWISATFNRADHSLPKIVSSLGFWNILLSWFSTSFISLNHYVSLISHYSLIFGINYAFCKVPFSI